MDQRRPMAGVLAWWQRVRGRSEATLQPGADSLTGEALRATSPLPVTTEVIEQGVRVTLEVPAGMMVHVTVQTSSEGAPPIVQHSAVVSVPSSRPWPQLKFPAPLRALPRLNTGERWFFGAALLVYVLTRFIALDQFPIYFLSDEAIHTVRAAELVDGRFTYRGEFLPTYFDNGPFWNLSVSVYAQLVPYLIFGESVLATRGTSIFISLLAAAAVGLTLRDIFKMQYWWTAALLLGLMPVWFLHSRTALEAVQMAAWYAAFLYAYLRYRAGATRWLYAVVMCAALTFYSYSPGQVVIGVTGLLLLTSDAGYHWQNRATVLRATALLIVLALPYMRFQSSHGEALYRQLRDRGASAFDPNVSLSETVTRTTSEWLYGLSPMYWYFPENGRDLVRHVMAGYGNLPLWTLPLAVLGLALAVRRAREPNFRAVLITLLATPAGGALTEVGNLRSLAFVIPITLLTGLGLVQVLVWMERRLPRTPLAIGAVIVLASVNGWMLRDAVANGPRWTNNYGLYGLQYGAPQLFGEVVPRLLRQHPTARLIISPSWANGTDALARFFLSAGELDRVALEGMEYFRSERRAVDDVILLWQRDEYNAALDEPKYGKLSIEEIVPYPDGTPGFYLLRLRYAANADALFAAEAAARRQPVTEMIELEGQSVTVTHSRLDGGALADLFDADPFTLARGAVDNPLAFDLRFQQARPFTSLTLTTATMERFTVRVRAYPPVGEPWRTEQTFTRLPTDPTFSLSLAGAPAQIVRLEIEIRDHFPQDPAHIHVREIVIR
ncbi:MAG: ArnT family glycosyltransferase [Anaerolineales bacterium]